MRQAMQQAQDAVGLTAERLLRAKMTASSYSDLQTLLELYPSSVIELGVYATPVGELPNRNTVIWEVRNY